MLLWPILIAGAGGGSLLSLTCASCTCNSGDSCADACSDIIAQADLGQSEFGHLPAILVNISADCYVYAEILWDTELTPQKGDWCTSTTPGVDGFVIRQPSLAVDGWVVGNPVIRDGWIDVTLDNAWSCPHDDAKDYFWIHAGIVSPSPYICATPSAPNNSSPVKYEPTVEGSEVRIRLGSSVLQQNGTLKAKLLPEDKQLYAVVYDKGFRTDSGRCYSKSSKKMMFTQQIAGRFTGHQGSESTLS